MYGKDTSQKSIKSLEKISTTFYDLLKIITAGTLTLFVGQTAFLLSLQVELYEKLYTPEKMNIFEKLNKQLEFYISAIKSLMELGFFLSISLLLLFLLVESILFFRDKDNYLIKNQRKVVVRARKTVIQDN